MADAKRVRLESVFGKVERAPPDGIFHVKSMFLADKDPRKVNLGVGGEEGERVKVMIGKQRRGIVRCALGGGEERSIARQGFIWGGGGGGGGGTFAMSPPLGDFNPSK